MSSMICSISKRMLAGVADIGLFSGVPSPVNFESACSHESVVAFIAFIGSFTCVSSHMVSKMALSGKRSGTALMRAWIRLFAVVYSNVDIKISTLCECFLAIIERARKWLLTSLYLLN